MGKLRGRRKTREKQQGRGAVRVRVKEIEKEPFQSSPAFKTARSPPFSLFTHSHARTRRRTSHRRLVNYAIMDIGRRGLFSPGFVDFYFYTFEVGVSFS